MARVPACVVVLMAAYARVRAIAGTAWLRGSGTVAFTVAVV